MTEEPQGIVQAKLIEAAQNRLNMHARFVDYPGGEIGFNRDVRLISRQPYPAPDVERAWKAGFCRGDNRHYPLPPTSEEIDAAWRASKTFKGLTALTGDTE